MGRRVGDFDRKTRLRLGSAIDPNATKDERRRGADDDTDRYEAQDGLIPFWSTHQRTPRAILAPPARRPSAPIGDKGPGAAGTPK